MRMWRTMFSISTIASSTSTPATSASASSDRKLRLIPIIPMNQKAGIADKRDRDRGDDRGADVPQEQEDTTRTARIAPSTSARIELSYWLVV